MQIADFLASDNVLCDVRAADKDRLLRELTERAARALHLEAAPLCDVIARREQLGSTGVGDGIAIPHARVASLSKPFGILARLRRPIDFAAIDGKAVDLVFLLLLPVAPNGEPLTALASVARRLRNAEVAARLRGARDGGEIFRVVCDDR